MMSPFSCAESPRVIKEGSRQCISIIGLAANGHKAKIVMVLTETLHSLKLYVWVIIVNGWGKVDGIWSTRSDYQG